MKMTTHSLPVFSNTFNDYLYNIVYWKGTIHSLPVFSNTFNDYLYNIVYWKGLYTHLIRRWSDNTTACRSSILRQIWKIFTKIGLLAGRASTRESHFSGSSGSRGLLRGSGMIPGLRNMIGTQNDAKLRERGRKIARKMADLEFYL